jgi:hypothetical protein
MYRNDDTALFKNATSFFENHQNSVGLAEFEFKNGWFLEFKFRIFEKIYRKICKKLDQILRTLVEIFFSNHRSVLLDKIQIDSKP